MSNNIVKKLEKILKRIKKHKFISIDDALQIEELTRYKISKILDEIRSRRAKKYIFRPSNIIINFYTGRDKEYLILPEVWFCSCLSAHPSNLLRRRVCYHLLVYKISEALDMIENYEVEDENYEWIINELK